MDGETIKNFWMNGYAVFKNVYDPNTVKVMKDEMANFVDKFDLQKENVEDFETKKNNRANYFLDSAWQMKPFFEEDAKDKDGKLIVDK